MIIIIIKTIIFNVKSKLTSMLLLNSQNTWVFYHYYNTKYKWVLLLLLLLKL